jgi:gamma-glutamyltranspeptidase/glutathione hydrolase
VGNAASLTASTGSGSGVIVPGTGILMNNMLGESDLNPAGGEARPGHG